MRLLKVADREGDEGMTMHRCEMESEGRIAMPCNERASTKTEGRWYCALHADLLAEAEVRWSGVNWFPLDYNEQPEKCESLFDDDEEQ
jgi:hypothetical protein